MPTSAACCLSRDSRRPSTGGPRFDATIGCSWAQLAERLTATAAVGRWVDREPDLKITAVEELLVDQFDPAADDRLGCLIRLSRPATGCPVDRSDADDAVLVVLHLLRGPILNLAFRLAATDQDALALVVGQVVEQIKSFPTTRHRAYALNVLRDAEAALLMERRLVRSRRVRPGDVTLLSPVADPAAAGGLSDGGGLASHLDRVLDAQAACTRGTDDDLTFAELAAWALRTGRIDRCGLQTLLQVTRLRTATPRARNIDRVATEHGVSRTTVDRRCARTLRALRAAGPAYLQHRDQVPEH